MRANPREGVLETGLLQHRQPAAGRNHCIHFREELQYPRKPAAALLRGLGDHGHFTVGEREEGQDEIVIPVIDAPDENRGSRQLRHVAA